MFILNTEYRLKPDIFTNLRIMSSNEWGLEPVLYKTAEVLAWSPDIEAISFESVVSRLRS